MRSNWFERGAERISAAVTPSRIVVGGVVVVLALWCFFLNVELHYYRRETGLVDAILHNDKERVDELIADGYAGMPRVTRRGVN